MLKLKTFKIDIFGTPFPNKYILVMASQKTYIFPMQYYGKIFNFYIFFNSNTKVSIMDKNKVF